jgi:hypothetical protein
MVEMGEEHNVRWVCFQQIGCWVPPVSLQKEQPIPQDRVGQDPYAADVDEYRGVTYVVDLNQVDLLVSFPIPGREPPAGYWIGRNSRCRR